MKTFTTKLHHYCHPSKRHPAYKAMVAAIKANADGRGHWSNMSGVKRTEVRNDTETVEVEVEFLFGNQWNTADGRRVFDWFEEYAPHSDDIRGHWVEITPEMAEARRQTVKCGYCCKLYGPFHGEKPGAFCTACLDSEHLKPEDLRLLRLAPVAEEPGGVRKEIPPLTDDERAALMPQYVERQTTGTDSRAKQRRDRQRADALAEFEKTVKDATAERDGMMWLWDHGVSLDNVIYYEHTGKFSFGWRSPVAAEVKSKLLDLLTEFPFPYEIKAADGTKTATL
jgi:hypothetical protein